jgi:DNA replication protein DnaC
MTPSKKPTPPSRPLDEQTLRQQILQHLETLNIPLANEQLDALLKEADQSRFSHLQFLARFLAIPSNQRLERSIERRIRIAKFRDNVSLETFDWSFNASTIDRLQLQELATGDFVRRRDNLVFVGASGLGKSHLIQGVGRQCCVLGYRVRYTTSADLLEDLMAASGDKTLPRRVRFYGRFDLLIIDEFGFDRLERREYPESSSLLYKVIDHRSGRGSTALVTNVDFKEWTEYLGDPPLAMALLDRVVDGAIIHKLHGRSYRAHRAERQGQPGGKPSRSAAKRADAPSGSES